MQGKSPKPKTIAEAMSAFLNEVKLARSRHTMLAYRNGLNIFRDVLDAQGLPVETTPVTELTEDLISPLATYLKTYAPATERTYLQAAKGLYMFLDAERLVDINHSRLTILIRQRSRKPGHRIPQFPADELERLIGQVQDIKNLIEAADEANSEGVKLRAYRDRAFLLTLADTGFRVHEACKLRRGDVNWNEGYAIIIGKQDKEAVVRFTSRSIQAIRDYISQRALLDGNSGRQLSSLPVFARHDKGAGKKIKPITTTTGRNIVNERVGQLLGKDMVGRITPHSFRHYFVTAVLRSSGNLKLAQKLARHENIQVTERYTHLADEELDKAYYEIFERPHRRVSSEKDVGLDAGEG